MLYILVYHTRVPVRANAYVFASYTPQHITHRSFIFFLYIASRTIWYSVRNGSTIIFMYSMIHFGNFEELIGGWALYYDTG